MQHGDLCAGALFGQFDIVEQVFATRETFLERRLAAVSLEDEQVSNGKQPSITAGVTSE
jgi:hypothetical protein